MIPTGLTMESLALPQDLYWNGKMEPTSPPSSELFPTSESVETWLLEDNFANDILFVEHKNVDIKNIPSEICHDYNHGEELVLEFDYDDVKEEPWSEVKSSSPQQMIDFESSVFESVFHHPSMVTKVQNPYEGENYSKPLYNNAAILTQLTPPQSPPQPVLTPPQSPPQESQDVKEIFDYFSSQQIAQQHQQQQQQQHQRPQLHHDMQTSRIPEVFQNIASTAAAPVPAPVNATLPSPSTPITYTPNAYNATQSSDIAQNCQIVDEIVENRAKELPDWHDDNTEYRYFISSLSPPPQTDEDWAPTSPSNSSSSLSSASSMIGDSSSSSDGGGKMQSSSSLAKKRTRPYGRGLEDRKSRKKEQNKNAATRYRQKKKQEMETVVSEEQALSNHHKELSTTLAERKREAKYLKKLIREFYQNKKF